MSDQSFRMKGYRAAVIFSTRQAGSVREVVSTFYHVLVLVDEALKKQRTTGVPVAKISAIMDEMGAHAVAVRPAIQRAFMWSYLSVRDWDSYFSEYGSFSQTLDAARVVHRVLSVSPPMVGFLEVQSKNGREVSFYAPYILPQTRAKDEIRGYAEAHHVISSARIVGRHARAAVKMVEVLRNE